MRDFCKSYDAPSENLRRECSCKCMHSNLRGQECREYVGARVSKEVADDVDYDDAGGSKLDVHLLLDADNQCHHHRDDRQQQLVLNSSQPASEYYGHMEHCKKMNNPACT